MGAPRSVRRGPLVRRRWLRAAPLAALAVAVSLLVPSAGRAVPGGRATLVSSSAALAGNPARGARQAGGAGREAVPAVPR